ncbi:spore gernimation protein [Pueribacillus theae]|uniref:Spore gernimation protein n=1 Tax=Pueribacillus theae TaxID=2171751 RepID=A0A2U1JZJ6_9BACI|nr:GerAB/ArcD/ProY family transporter [Pueribacillus theae]PWA10415.1 spore gernimation protein [Pueribacillus theae]
MAKPKGITVAQTTAILISSIIGVGVLRLPLTAVQAGDTGAPLVTLLGVSVASVGVWVVAKLSMRFPNQSIIEYSEVILGKWLGRLYGFLMIAFFIILTGLGAREFGEVVVTAVLKETPIEVIVIVMLFMATMFVRHDLHTFAYIHSFYVPFILAPTLIIIVLSLKNANPLYLQPVFGNELNINAMLYGVLIVASLFQTGFIVSLIFPAMEKPEKAMKAGMWGIAVTSVLYVMVVVAILAVFGPEEVKKLNWPTLELTRATSFPGKILQRLDVVFLAIWVTAVFTTIFSGYMFTIRSLSQLLKLRDHKLFSMFFLPIFFVIAMVPENVMQMYKIIETVGAWGLVITIAPIFLLITAKARKLPAKRSGA